MINIPSFRIVVTRTRKSVSDSESDELYSKDAEIESDSFFQSWSKTLNIFGQFIYLWQYGCGQT